MAFLGLIKWLQFSWIFIVFQLFILKLFSDQHRCSPALPLFHYWIQNSRFWQVFLKMAPCLDLRFPPKSPSGLWILHKDRHVPLLGQGAGFGASSSSSVPPNSFTAPSPPLPSMLSNAQQWLDGSAAGRRSFEPFVNPQISRGGATFEGCLAEVEKHLYFGSLGPCFESSVFLSDLFTRSYFENSEFHL